MRHFFIPARATAKNWQPDIYVFGFISVSNRFYGDSGRAIGNVEKNSTHKSVGGDFLKKPVSPMQRNTMAFVRYLLPLISSIAAFCFGRFLGSEGIAIMTTGKHLVLLGILLWGLIFLFRIYFFNLKKKVRLYTCLYNIYILSIFHLFLLLFY